MGARYYDPAMGRFVSMDPKGFDEESVHRFNRYAYANNNPSKYVDPDGRSPLAAVLWTTGAGYAVGVAADVLSQYAAWGSVDLSIAATSNAAIAGGAAGFLSGLIGGGLAASSAREEVTYKIVDGVRRSKAAELTGNATIRAEIEGTGGKTGEIAIDALRSPKEVIETAGSGAKRWASVLEGTRAGADMPPILVRPSSAGIPIRDVKVQ